MALSSQAASQRPVLAENDVNNLHPGELYIALYNLDGEAVNRL